jgi:hypothetical protein
MLEECEEPEIVEWDVQREIAGESGMVRTWCTVRVEVLEPPRAGERYIVHIDPSKGINDKAHDPGGILISKESTGEDVVLYEGYLGSYGLGTLGAALGLQYNYAKVSPENNSGWAEGVLRGLADSGYGNVAHTRKPTQPGKWETELGFATTTKTRPAMIEAGQEWVEAYRAGTPYAPCRFRRVIEAFRQTILDLKGKVVAAPGYHDEFVILKGQSLLMRRRRHDPNAVRHRPPVDRRQHDPERELAKWVMGEDEPARIGGGAVRRLLIRPPTA